MSEKLSFLDHDPSDSEVEFKINEQYANRYNVWRNKEELQKYKDLKKEEDDSETSSESDEEMPEFDEEFFRALSLLKGKDPRIYDKNYELFSNKEVKKSKTVKDKPMYMKDYERNLVLERGGKFSDDDEPTSSKTPTYDEEQEILKKSLKEALQDSDDDNDLLQVRVKTEKEEDEDDADYLKWLKGEKKEVSEDIKKDMSYLKNYWSDPKLDEGEKFLRDYILNKRHLEKDDTEIPTYEQITSGMLSDDEKMIEEQEKFEHKYNFRFEEPDEEFIKRYPRTIGNSLRKTDTRRKEKRDEKAERRRREREQRREELKRLKALKRKEMEEKFSKLKEVSGQKEINLNESDMESDFDPDKHDQKMREMFNDDYYGVKENQKPEFAFDEELDEENWNAWTGENIDNNDEDDGENDHEIDSQEHDEIIDQQESKNNPKEDFQKEMIEATLPKKKVKKKSLFAKVISQSKPLYDPDGKSFDEYLDEYYKLDYEDIVGDLPVRYKYRKVIPNNFGLTVEEILSADDRELNRWCSVKKTCQYRNDDEEIYDVQAYKKKSQNILTMKKVFSSLFAPKDLVNEINDDTFEHKSENTKHLSSGSNDVAVNQDEAINGISDDYDQETEPNTSMKSNQTKKKCKKKKHKEKFHSSHMNSKSGNKSILEFESVKCLENGDPIFNQKTKAKKIKDIEVTKISTDNEENSIYSKSDLESSKSIMKKRKLGKNEFSDSEKNVNVPQNKNKSKHNDASNHHNVNSSFNSISVPESSFHETVKKKKKRKKKSISDQPAMSRNQFSQSKTHKFKDNNHIGNVSSDKRLALSDERLAAYGINPKKFKNRIIYSKK